MLCLLAAAAVGSLSTSWYGPGTVEASLPYTGDPYDPDVNDVEVDFVGKHGEQYRRLAYFIGDGRFASTLVAPKPGKFTARFLVNGKQVAERKDAVDIETKLAHGFIGLSGRRFAWSDGSPYFPIGYDYAWQGVPGETVPQGLAKMGKSGANWSRIWSNHWDNKNPFFPEKGQTIPGRELRQEPLRNWDGIIKAAETSGVCFQFVLFHHGPYSTTTDSNWGEHPWNTKNGGFLADPTDFFTNEEAKRRTKIWLRYAVARYASSPAVMSWEMFNEVQWVDAIKKNPGRVGDVAAWHKEMIAYLKSLDPYHHLVTSSSSESLNSGVFDSVDYMQPHTYPSNVLASIGGTEFKDKPGFFGEFGPPGGPGSPSYNRQVRDGIYGGILAGHAGAGMYWFWDQVDRAKLGPTFFAARQVIDYSGLLTHPTAKPMTLQVSTPRVGDLTISAGGGWAESTLTEISLPDVDLRSLGGWSPYFQSMDGGNKKWAKPLMIKFTAKEPGKVTLGVGEASATGGNLKGWVNDKVVFDEVFSKQGRLKHSVTLDYPAGPVLIRLENHGQDWVRLDSITVPGLAPTASSHGLGEANWALVRVFGSDTSDVTIKGLTLRDGRYKLKVFDAIEGTTTPAEAVVKAGTAQLKKLPEDAVIAFGS